MLLLLQPCTRTLSNPSFRLFSVRPRACAWRLHAMPGLIWEPLWRRSRRLAMYLEPISSCRSLWMWRLRARKQRARSFSLTYLTGREASRGWTRRRFALHSSRCQFLAVDMVPVRIFLSWFKAYFFVEVDLVLFLMAVSYGKLLELVGFIQDLGKTWLHYCLLVLYLN